jgi:ComF family protein
MGRGRFSYQLLSTRIFTSVSCARRVLEWGAGAISGFLVPDVCYLCRRPAQHENNGRESGPLPPQCLSLAAPATVELVPRVFLTNHPFCDLCLRSLKPAIETFRIGDCGLTAGAGWARTVRGELFVHRPCPASGTVPGVPPGESGHTGLRVISPLFMDDNSLEIIHFIKFSGRRSIVPLVAGSMVYALRQSPRIGSDALLVPVPMFPSARRRRGFNQAELLAARISSDTQHRVLYGALRKVSRSKRQSDLSPDERADNIRGVFGWTGPGLSGSHVVLVDDLVTSGATAAACASVLLAAGASRVTVLCFARAA